MTATSAADMQPIHILTSQERFFWDNAGYSYALKGETPEQGRTQCARLNALAEAAFFDAEAYAGVTFAVDTDDEDYAPDEADPRSQGPSFIMSIFDADGRVLAGVGAVDDESPTNRRVIRAELAHEVLDELRALTAANQ